MLHIIGLVLKIIGIIVLIILGLILLVILLALFFPLCYDLSIEKEDGKDFRFSGSFFIFHFPKKNKNKKSGKKKRRKKKKAEETKVEAELEDLKDNRQDTTGADDERRKNSSSSEAEASHQNHKKTKQKKSKDHKKKKLGSGSILEDIKSLWNNDSYKEALQVILNEVISSLKKVFPKRAEGDVEFSLGSPDLTGYTLGLISLWPMSYDRHLAIKPDFQADEPYVRGNLSIKGRIQLYQFLGSAIRIISKKSVRSMIKDIMG